MPQAGPGHPIGNLWEVAPVPFHRPMERLKPVERGKYARPSRNRTEKKNRVLKWNTQKGFVRGICVAEGAVLINALCATAWASLLPERNCSRLLANLACAENLLPRREVALLGAGLVAAVVAVEINASERAVVLEVGRRIGERILTAQLFLDLFEAVRHFLD
jgi:hypothetical protein